MKHEDESSENTAASNELEERRQSLADNELLIGTVVSFDADGKPQVVYKVGDTQLTHPALATVSLHSNAIGRQVAIMFVAQDPKQPIVIGLIKSRLDDLLDILEPKELEVEMNELANLQQAEKINPAEKISENLQVDGKRVTIEGQEEIVLKCGDSSITLTKAGKILIRGKYLLNRSTGVNRIMGGSVQVN